MWINTDTDPVKQRTRLVIVGGGFGGLALAKLLRNSPIEVLLIDRSNHHLFQPLLYQVATAALAPTDIAAPFRSALKPASNLRFLLDEVIGIDRRFKRVHLRSKDVIDYDFIVVACGAEPFYYGSDHWRTLAPGLKTIEDAIQIREKLFLSLEMASQVKDHTERQRLMTFVVIGGGPTGVEVAGALAEIGREVLRSDYPELKQASHRVLLIEAGERLLPAHTTNQSMYTLHALEELGVEVRLNTRVQDIRPGLVIAGTERILSDNVVWGAGNRASRLLAELKCPLDAQGRAYVEPDLSLADDPCCFVIGDAAHAVDDLGVPLPALAPVATQQGQYLARILLNGTARGARPPFRYRDRGIMATIGRAKAVASLYNKIHFTGFLAWLSWSLVHVALLVNFRNRSRVMLEWIWFYLTRKPGARLLHLKILRSN